VISLVSSLCFSNATCTATPRSLTGEVVHIPSKLDEILIDFTPKGGPKNLLGKWTGTGILFPDGNEWKKLDSK
jgi:hypothetical protein